ncbi:FAD-binding oxidoreductase [Cereibacter sphaeroides]|uniref:NAD(P)/FAD-dependent oxidoreductase n=1 Tax=Cereibacter sphaeroides TaxID=1063 RepID=UPI000F53CDC0|nr:FAD-dependent oxidoreductase [Cereibacter sphaeroides]AZB55872.1 FAD-binding oxidoreductase [Cereibacter sphaeroides]AZB60134.1 FAD-binding oxidoreductase [Cereibacter sphaeroides]AZB64311.1 FAD-binding oxidoreductase [Cereibacter sphaeroides]AZB67762.1 FAD-binding oxidoreductase [Cereibacter sphaeroides]
MIQHLSSDTVVIGGGVVGLTIALTVARRHRSVILLDPEEPGSGASYGNAGTIADYAVLPVGTPDVLRQLPSLMFDRNSPLAIRHMALPSLAPWLARFLRQSLPAPARRNAQAIAALLGSATRSWEDLAVEVEGTALLNRRGCLYAYETPQAARAAETDMTFRRTLGVTVELLSAAEFAAMEPSLPPMAGAAYFPKAIFLSDPGRMVALIAEAARKAGVQIVKARATGLERRVDGVIVSGRGLQIHGRRAVIAAGAHSRALALCAGDRVPLDTERGYHVEWDMAQPPLTRPTCPTARGFYLCPMAGRLRVAGTVELGGLTAPPSPHRIARLVAGARAIFPHLPEPTRSWMGFRPSMPDSLPVIGPSAAGPEILHAYGHGHIGLTLAPITARIVADLLDAKTPELDIAPYLPTRF